MYYILLQQSYTDKERKSKKNKFKDLQQIELFKVQFILKKKETTTEEITISKDTIKKIQLIKKAFR